MSFSGEIKIEPVKVTGFRIAGFSVQVRSFSSTRKGQGFIEFIQDCLLLTVTPPDVTKAAFIGIREMIPVRLTTDPWTEDGRGILAPRQSLSVPPSPEEMPDNFAHAI
jgi:hypothetical protein